MFCSNCGKEYKEGELFCGGCGIKIEQTTPVVEEQLVDNGNVVVQNVPPMKKGMPTWLVILLIIIVTLFILGAIFVVFFAILFGMVSELDFDDFYYEQTSSYVYVDEEEIPSIYYYFGEYSLCDYPETYYEDGLEITSYSYCDDEFGRYIMEEYLNYLIEEYDYEEYEVSSNFKSIKVDSVEEGYSLVVKAYFYGEYIEYYKIKNDFIEEDNGI